MKAAVIDAPNTEMRIEERNRPSPAAKKFLSVFTPAVFAMMISCSSLVNFHLLATLSCQDTK